MPATARKVAPVCAARAARRAGAQQVALDRGVIACWHDERHGCLHACIKHSIWLLTLEGTAHRCRRNP